MRGPFPERLESKMSALLPAATLVLCAAASCASTPAPLDGTWIDLSHGFSGETIYWPTASGFELTVDAKGPTEAGYWYEANTFRTAEHGGTHLDAPAHFAEGRLTADEIPIERLVGPAAVIDVSERALADRDYQVSVQDLRDWERRHGRLPAGAIVLLYTGYDRFWPDRVRYMGTDERGAEAVAKLHFPGLHPDAATWLVAERAIDAVGLDTPSIDYGQSKLFETHRILFAADVPAFENVSSLGRLPATGATIVALPMKIVGGSGGPLRIVALVPE